MSRPITMPALSDTMSNGRLVKWIKKIGDPIKRGDSIADVETDKAVMGVEAFHDGYLAGPLAAEGSEMPVGATIGYIAESLDATAMSSAATGPSPAVASTQGVALPARLAVSPPPPGPTAPSAPSPLPTAAARVRASPYARRLALMASLATPTFHMTARLALAPLLAASKDTGMSLTLLLVRACALTVKAHILFNAMYTLEGLAPRERVDVAIAVDTLRGLVAPVIRDAAERPLAELAVDWRNLHENALGCRLRVEDYQGATFHLSNLGMYSIVDSFDAMLPAGVTAILCIAATDGERTAFTLGCDHRVVGSADAARFLKTLADYLANPDGLTDKPQRAAVAN